MDREGAGLHFQQFDAQVREAAHASGREVELAGLGALVAGISHELNTPLGNALTVATTLAEETRKLEKKSKFQR